MNTNIAIRLDQVVKVFGGKPTGALTRLNGPAGGVPVPGRAAARGADGVSFEVLAGEIFGLVGPNGSGKSTLMRLIAAQLAPEHGHIEVFSRDAPGDPRTDAGLVGGTAVEATFFKKLSPVENLLYGARAYALHPGRTRRRVVELLGRLGLPAADLYRPLETLSRGTQQKVALARAFLAEPRVLLLDEPTNGLDPRSRRDVHGLIRELRHEQGMTVLLATHDLAEAEALCDRVAILDHGRLVALDTAAGLKQSAARPTLEEAFLALTGGNPVTD